MIKGGREKKIECRGKNGWFDYERFTVSVIPMNDPPAITYVQIRPRRGMGGWAPITITGPAEQVLALLEDIAGEIRQALAKPKLEILVVIDDGNISKVVASRPNDVKILELNRENGADDWHNEYVSEVDPEAISEFHESRE